MFTRYVQPQKLESGQANPLVRQAYNNTYGKRQIIHNYLHR